MFVSETREAIASLRATGMSASAIARALELAPTTVSYHVMRLERDDTPAPAEAQAARELVVARSRTRAEVARMLSEGVQRNEIARRLEISKATVSYHARRLGHPVDGRFGRRYDWEAVQRYYDAGHSVRESMSAFGFSAATWSDAVRRGAIVARPSAMPISALLVADTYRGRYNLKARLLKEGLKETRCERCGLVEWRGRPLIMALHHLNGQRNDNRFENLQLLCPNCHSQTKNFAGRNGLRRRGTVPAAEGADASAPGEAVERPARRTGGVG